MPAGGLSDEELLRRLRAIYCMAVVDEVAEDLQKARASGNTAFAREIHARYTYRMHDLSEFMKTLLQRMTQWFNRQHQRTGTLWESRFTSVIVESGIAARMMAAYIDLNPVRAGMVSDPAKYRWSSYGEAVGGGAKGNGNKAREGLVRACTSHQGGGFNAEKWQEVSKIYRKMMGLALERKAGKAQPQVAAAKSKRLAAVTKKSLEGGAELNPNGVKMDANETILPELTMSEMLCYRVRYFTAGAVIGSKAFVNEVFTEARERFGTKRKDGARSVRGSDGKATGVLWSARDLRVKR